MVFKIRGLRGPLTPSVLPDISPTRREISKLRSIASIATSQEDVT